MLERTQTTRGAKSPPVKVFLLAIDATSLAYLEENIAALPNLGRLLRGGRVVKPASAATLLNASLWQTFASGLPAGETGHYFPLQWDPSAMRFLQMKDDERLDFKPFWNELADRGVETIVFDITSVPVGSNDAGIQIIDWNGQCNVPARTNREDILRQLRRRFGTRPIKDEIPVKKSRRMLTHFRDDMINSVRKKSDAILWLMREHEWQFFVTSYFEGHRAGHNLWPIWDDFASDPPEDALLDVYREIDTQIGRLQEALDLSKTALVIFSMHGMSAGYAQDHFLPVVVDRINALYLQKTGRAVPRHEKPRIARMLRQTVPPAIQYGVRKLVGQRVQDWLIDREWRGGRDWSQTPAFPVPCGGDNGFIRLNLKGREREGFLSSEERPGYVAFLCDTLRALRVKESGERLVSDIFFAEDEFPGPRSYLLPDLILLWAPERPAKEIWTEELGSIKAELKTGRGGIHTGDGFAILAGALDRLDNQVPPLSDVRDYKTLVTSLLGA
jgi:predicted AlkP superfamily phosphohydrolase/phosphomutase